MTQQTIHLLRQGTPVYLFDKDDVLTSSLDPMCFLSGRPLSATGVGKLPQDIRLLGGGSIDVLRPLATTATGRGVIARLHVCAQRLGVDGFTGSALRDMVELDILPEKWRDRPGSEQDFMTFDPPECIYTFPLPLIYHLGTHAEQLHMVRPLKERQYETISRSPRFAPMSSAELTPGTVSASDEFQARFEELVCSVDNGGDGVGEMDAKLFALIGSIMGMTDNELQCYSATYKVPRVVKRTSTWLYTFDGTPLLSPLPIMVYRDDALEVVHTNARGMRKVLRDLEIINHETTLTIGPTTMCLLERAFPDRKEVTTLEQATEILDFMLERLCDAMGADGIDNIVLRGITQNCGGYFRNRDLFDTLWGEVAGGLVAPVCFCVSVGLGPEITPWPRGQNFAIHADVFRGRYVNHQLQYYVFCPDDNLARDYVYPRHRGGHVNDLTVLSTLDNLVPAGSDVQSLLGRYRADFKRPIVDVEQQHAMFNELLAYFHQEVESILQRDRELYRLRLADRDAVENGSGDSMALAIQRSLHDRFRERSVEEMADATFPVSPGVSDDDGTFECQSCYLEWPAPQAVAVALCGHIVCRNCIGSMSRTGIRCSACRTEAEPTMVNGVKVPSILPGFQFVRAARREVGENYNDASVQPSKEYLLKNTRMLPRDAEGLAANGLCPVQRRPNATTGMCPSGGPPSLRDAVDQPCCTLLEAASNTRERKVIINLLLREAPGREAVGARRQLPDANASSADKRARR